MRFRAAFRNHAALWTTLALSGVMLHAPISAGPDASPEAGTRTGDLLVARADGPISSVMSEFVSDAIERARRGDYAALILELDTPGGLMISMDTIIKSILASEVPVIVYVTPAGAEASSAGLYITNASDVAVMAPGTKIGAGHPVQSDGSNPGGETPEGGRNFMNEKIENAAAAGVRSIAATRGRNVEVYERMVLESIALTAEEALDQNVIDLVSKDLEALKADLHGYEVKRFDGTRTVLSVADASIHRLEMTPRQRVLSWLTNPTIAFLLLSVGLIGLYVEFNNPGLIFPGVAGAIALVLFAISAQIIPTNVLGILLIIVALVLFILEMNVTSYGLLSLGGILALTLGFLTLFDLESVPSLRPTLGFILPTSITVGLIMGIVTSLGLAAQRSRVVTGKEALAGALGEAVTAIEDRGKVFVHGEYWDAASATPIGQGSRVKIVSVDGLLLHVEPVDRPRKDPS